MNVKSITKLSCALLASLIISSCGIGQLLSGAPTPTALLTAISAPTLMPTPVVASVDDNLCEIKGSFLIDGELCYTDDVCTMGTAQSTMVEGSPSYSLGLLGYSKDGTPHFRTIWIKHSLSPGPNEMQTLPDKFKISDIIIYTANNIVLRSDLMPVRLKVHSIPALITEPGPGTDPSLSCDYVVEEIQLH